MKRLKTFFARRGAVPAACYILAVAVWLVLSLAHAGSDALAKAQGRMTEQIIPVQSWQLVGLEPAEEQATAESALTLTTTNGDPQMILEDVSGQVVRTLSYTVTFDGDAREMCLYYTTKVGEDYSQDRRVFPQNLGNGQYLYTLQPGREQDGGSDLCPGDPDPERRLDSARLVAVPCPHLVSNLLPHPLPRPVRVGGQPDSFLLCKEGTEETLNKNGRYGRRPYLPF